MIGSDFHVTVSASSLPKKGNSKAEYEDAYAFLPTDTFPYRAAVADGATESAYARLWARILVRSFTQEGDLSSNLADCRTAWREHLGNQLDDIPWYQEQKLDQGAYATFIGIELFRDGSWKASAVGDCCLFHFFQHGGMNSWPHSSGEGFHHQPDLISSSESGDEISLRERRGDTASGDVFLLATDAVAEWLLQNPPQHLGAWETRWEEARQNNKLRNDDCTLVQLTVTL